MGKAGAIIGGVVIILIGLAIVVAAIFFSDWSGRHRISWPGAAVGAVVVLLGAVPMIVRLRR